MNTCMVTTIDNPYNPFTSFKEWYAYDFIHGYKTCEWLAHFARTSTELSEEDYNDEINQAINDLLELNPLGIHMKVYEKEAETLIRLANEAFEESKRTLTT